MEKASRQSIVDNPASSAMAGNSTVHDSGGGLRVSGIGCAALAENVAIIADRRVSEPAPQIRLENRMSR